MSGAEIAALIASVWAGAAAIEVCAAALGVTYVVLVIGQYRACWLAALASTALYLYVCYAQALYMQAALQAYYVVVALYGWRVWRAAPGRAPLPVSRAAWHLQLAGLAGVLAASAASASWLARETASTQPLLDSLTTWASDPLSDTGWMALRNSDRVR